MIPEFETISTSTKISELCSNDIDLNITNNIDCKYYTNHEFSKLTNNTNDLNILHANVNGIESHFEVLHCLITDSSLDFNILCISETSQKENVEFHKNILLLNFQKPYSTGSKSGKGGTAIFISNNVEAMERCDLKISDLEFESTWVEIKNDKRKNIIIGWIYRHPHHNNLYML